ncbi:hypothetical protein [Leptospira sp. GIMC2001]|uniref:hypothetical protein n=1 Tax=Leptospira sp. GIMC2001 TaxID=1513297 RepID=UPI0023493AD9|nr:hypothetical protein [Leptospira sp. GIMC2001]WCL49939.1 hypothetical protein O4O04_03725 [Leptospira sp. GIMC2001]
MVNREDLNQMMQKRLEEILQGIDREKKLQKELRENQRFLPNFRKKMDLNQTFETYQIVS